MKIFNTNINFKEFINRTLSIFSISIIITLFGGVYILGLIKGYVVGMRDGQEKILLLFNQEREKLTSIASVSPTLSPKQTNKPTLTPKESTRAIWGGPELWEAVNKRRIELGVNPLQQRDELCTIASIRLNELLTLGKLDNHEGFSNMSERRPDLKWIFEKYSTMAEFLAVGGNSAQETVSLWENTLGHKKLLTGGEFVWGCIYAQNTFAVAITAY